MLSYIADLKAGKTVKFRPKGRSMSGRIESGQLCTVEPVQVADLKAGDIVLAKVGPNIYLHIAKAIQGERVLIANARGKVNGWTGSVYGRCVKVEA